MGKKYPETIREYLYSNGIKGAVFIKNNQLYSVKGLDIAENYFVIIDNFNFPGHLFQTPLKNILEQRVIAIDVSVKKNLARETQNPVEETKEIPPVIEDF